MNNSRLDTAIVVVFLILVQGTGAVAGFWLPAIAPEAAKGIGLNASLIAYPVLILYVFAMISSLFSVGFVTRFGAWRTSQLALLRRRRSRWCLRILPRRPPLPLLRHPPARRAPHPPPLCLLDKAIIEFGFRLICSQFVLFEIIVMTI